MKKTYFLGTIASLSLGYGLLAGAAQAAPAAMQDGMMTAKECQQAYVKAKAAGTLNGQKISDFKSEHCPTVSRRSKSAMAKSEAAKSEAEKPETAKSAMDDTGTATAGTTNAGASNTGTTAAGTSAGTSTAATATSGGVVFPSAIDSKFASLSAGRARMKTCTAQYNANKTNGSGNGGLKWIQRGGGYWSECNAHLKQLTGQSSPTTTR